MSKLRAVSVALLALVGAATLLVSLVSARLAYVGDYTIGTTPLEEVGAGREGVLTALRGVRGTSAAYAAGYAALLLYLTFGPYRRGDRGAWWAILAAAVLMTLVSLARVPLLGVALGGAGTGTGTALTQLGLVVLALLLDVGRLGAAVPRQS
jgi:hypothetical protein